jgi:hypothetical protein
MSENFTYGGDWQRQEDMFNPDLSHIPTHAWLRQVDTLQETIDWLMDNDPAYANDRVGAREHAVELITLLNSE